MPPRLHLAAAAALLVCATLARAQQPPEVRVHREQRLVLARMPVGSEPELRVAPGLPTVLRFDAEVVHVEVNHEGPGRLVWVDVAGHSLLLEPRRELASDEKLPMEVVLAQGPARTRLVFQLVSHPGEVDARVDVELRPRSVRPELEPEVASSRREDGPFSRLVFSGVMGRSGITAGMFRGRTVGRGVLADAAWDYRAAHGRAITFVVRNEGARPWLASEVVRLPVAGEVSQEGSGWKVSMAAPIEPGGTGLVVLESVEAAGVPVRLEVREAGGIRSVRVEESR
jgi:uncharacterized protein (TIGR02268 family)